MFDAELLKPGEELFAGGLCVGVRTRVGVDQVQPEFAEKEFLAEARLVPGRLPRVLGDLPGMLLGHVSGGLRR